MVCDPITLLEFSIGNPLPPTGSGICMTPIQLGAIKSVNVRITGGVGPFTYKLFIDGFAVFFHMSHTYTERMEMVMMKSMVGNYNIEKLVSVTSKSQTRIFGGANEMEGSHYYEMLVTDSCLPIPQTARKGCTIEIVRRLCPTPTCNLTVKVG